MRLSLLWNILNCRKKSPSSSWPHNMVQLKKLVLFRNLVQPTSSLPSPWEARPYQDFASCTFYSRIKVLLTKFLHRKENPTLLWYFITVVFCMCLITLWHTLKMLQLCDPDIHVSSLHSLQITSHNFNVMVAPSYPTSSLSFFLCNSHHNEREYFRIDNCAAPLREKINWGRKRVSMKRLSFVCVSFIVLHIILGWLPSVSYAQYKIISWTTREILPGKIDSAPYLFLLLWCWISSLFKKYFELLIPSCLHNRQVVALGHS